MTLGPLTNLADAIQESLEVVENLEMIYAMGGALDVPGKVIKNGVADLSLFPILRWLWPSYLSGLGS